MALQRCAFEIVNNKLLVKEGETEFEIKDKDPDTILEGMEAVKVLY